MKFNQFAIGKAIKLGFDFELVKIMQSNSDFITDKNEIFEFFKLSEDKSNAIGSLLSTKFDFLSDQSGYTMLILAIYKKLKITPELLEVSDVNYIKYKSTALSIAL